VPAEITIDRDHRDGLYEVIRNHLAVIEDFWVAMERTRDFDTAEQLGLELAEDFRLLQDLGWGEAGERERFELTMPPTELGKALERLRAEAVEILVESGDEAQTSREDADTSRRFQLGHETCERALADLDQRAGT